MANKDSGGSTDWLGNQPLTDVQTAIQSSTIQTAIEKLTTSLTPQAIQSYMLQAPIPRFFYGQFLNNIPGPGQTTMTWGNSGYHDPLKMMVPATGIVTIPFDGYYTFSAWYIGTGAAGGTTRVWIDINGVAKAVNAVPPIVGTGVYEVATTYVVPLQAGVIVKCVIYNDIATTLTTNGAEFSGVWNSPLNNYVGGNG